MLAEEKQEIRKIQKEARQKRLELIEKRISEIIIIINNFEEKLKNQKFDMVLTLDDSQLFERSIIFSCKKQKIPIIMIQNGDL